MEGQVGKLEPNGCNDPGRCKRKRSGRVKKKYLVWQRQRRRKAGDGKMAGETEE